MEEAAQNHRTALVTSRCQKVLLNAEYRALYQMNNMINPELAKGTQIS